MAKHSSDFLNDLLSLLTVILAREQSCKVSNIKCCHVKIVELIDIGSESNQCLYTVSITSLYMM